MAKTEAIDKLRQELRDWATFLEDKVIDTAPGQCIDIDVVVCTKLDYIASVRAYRHYLDGYAIQSFDRMIDTAAAMENEHTVLAAYNAIRNTYDEATKVVMNNQGSEDEPCRHSEDFISVVWYGQKYHFTKMQAACVKVLWEHWQKDCPEVSEMTIGDASASFANKFRLMDYFRRGGMYHPAWKTMIQSAGKGMFKLDRPPQKKTCKKIQKK